MLFDPELHGQLARERIEREIARAELLRQTRPPATSIRQAVGQRFIRIGLRLGAEPTPRMITEYVPHRPLRTRVEFTVAASRSKRGSDGIGRTKD